MPRYFSYSTNPRCLEATDPEDFCKGNLLVFTTPRSKGKAGFSHQSLIFLPPFLKCALLFLVFPSSSQNVTSSFFFLLTTSNQGKNLLPKQPNVLHLSAVEPYWIGSGHMITPKPIIESFISQWVEGYCRSLLGAGIRDRASPSQTTFPGKRRLCWRNQDETSTASYS